MVFRRSTVRRFDVVVVVVVSSAAALFFVVFFSSSSSRENLSFFDAKQRSLVGRVGLLLLLPFEREEEEEEEEEEKNTSEEEDEDANDAMISLFSLLLFRRASGLCVAEKIARERRRDPFVTARF